MVSGLGKKVKCVLAKQVGVGRLYCLGMGRHPPKRLPVIAELKDFDCSDLSRDELPPDPENFEVWITAHIGLKGKVGADLFQFRFSAGPPRFGRRSAGPPPIVIDRFSWELVERELTRVCQETKGYSWEDLARSLAERSLWEYSGIPDPRSSPVPVKKWKKRGR